MKHLKIYEVLDGDKDALNFIFLHGYGANGRDLVGLSQHPALKKFEANWYFLEAPLSPPELQMFGGLAWFNLTLSEFNESAKTKDFSEFYNQENKELERSLSAIKETLWSLELNPSKTFMGGFSQGAMMAALTFFTEPENYKGLISFSGAPLQNKKWQELDESKPIFLSHGLQDPVLPFQCAKDLEDHTKKYHPQTQWFQGGHEISPEVLNALSQFVQKNI